MAEKTKDGIDMTGVTRDGIDLEIGVIEQDAIERMLEKTPMDEIVRDYLGDGKAERLNDLYEARDKLDKEVKMTEKTKFTVCPECVKRMNIMAVHRYEITQDDEGKFHKTDGEGEYRCGNCGYDLSVREIADALTQVDDL